MPGVHLNAARAARSFCHLPVAKPIGWQKPRLHFSITPIPRLLNSTNIWYSTPCPRLHAPCQIIGFLLGIIVKTSEQAPMATVLSTRSFPLPSLSHRTLTATRRVFLQHLPTEKPVDWQKNPHSIYPILQLSTCPAAQKSCNIPPCSACYLFPAFLPFRISTKINRRKDDNKIVFTALKKTE